MTEELCQMCGAAKSEHVESRPTGAPVPRNGCGSLLRYFRPRAAAPIVNWVKLKRGNDWGVDYFAIEPLNHGSADQRRGVRVVDGEPVTVRMADGTEVVGVITLREEHGTVSDMGHRYSVSSEIPEVAFTFHGQPLRVRIDEVEVEEAWARQRGAQ
jgi:hypothetical protein